MKTYMLVKYILYVLSFVFSHVKRILLLFIVPNMKSLFMTL